MLKGDDEGKFARQGVLVIANSGRMLADALRQVNYKPLVIDLFADQDTEAIAEQLWQVESLTLKAVQDVVEHLLLIYRIQGVIYGSGLEDHPETLEYLGRHFNIIGNDIKVVKQLSATQAFFKQLDKLNIRYPDVQFYPPANSAGWLIKPASHVGGLGISRCSRKAREGEYYQRFCPGEVGSVLFCADAGQFEIIGFQRQWTVNHDNFTFAGIMRDTFLPEAEQQRVRVWLKKLVSYFHLKGLASLDFIWDGTRCYCLEINPRPPASMMLYPELNLMGAHLTGKLTVTTLDNTVRAIQVIYAKQACKIKPLFEWPEWSFDRPKHEASIHIDEPICSIMAQETTVQQTLDSLQVRQITLENNLY